MAETDPNLKRIREICLALPDTKETITWGNPHFRVGEKIFCGYGDEKGVMTVGFKLEMQHAAERVRLPGFSKAPYTGHKGWVSLDVSTIGDWQDVADMILESYRLIAPKRSLSRLAQSPDEANHDERQDGLPRKRGLRSGQSARPRKKK